MRSKRKVLKAQEAEDKRLLEKSSLNIDLVPETEEDVRTASLMSFSAKITSEEKQEKAREAIIEESIFSTPQASALKRLTSDQVRRLLKCREIVHTYEFPFLFRSHYPDEAWRVLL
jgi:hypothetical protein